MLNIINDQLFSHKECQFIRISLKMQCKRKEENLTSYHKLRVILQHN